MSAREDPASHRIAFGDVVLGTSVVSPRRGILAWAFLAVITMGLAVVTRALASWTGPAAIAAMVLVAFVSLGWAAALAAAVEHRPWRHRPQRAGVRALTALAVASLVAGQVALCQMRTG